MNSSFNKARRHEGGLFRAPRRFQLEQTVPLRRANARVGKDPKRDLVFF